MEFPKTHGSFKLVIGHWCEDRLRVRTQDPAQARVAHLFYAASAEVVSRPTVKRHVPMAHSLPGTEVFTEQALGPEHVTHMRVSPCSRPWPGESQYFMRRVSAWPLEGLCDSVTVCFEGTIRPPARETCAPHHLRSEDSAPLTQLLSTDSGCLTCQAAVASCSGRSGNIIADLPAVKAKPCKTHPVHGARAEKTSVCRR